MNPILTLAWMVFPISRKALVTIFVSLVVAVLIFLLLLLLLFGRNRPFLPQGFPMIDISGISISTNAATEIPFDQIGIIIGAAERSPCNMPWNVLAGVARQESDFGRMPGMYTPHNGGILGYGQFDPATWAKYGRGGNIFSPSDALPAMAAYLCDLGVQGDAFSALMRYSGCWPPSATCQRTDNYASIVLDRAIQYGVSNTVPSLAAQALKLEQLAAQWLNFPYRLGGNGLSRTDGIDCSAFMVQIYSGVGIKLPRTAQLQYNAVTKFKPQDAQPGDLLFFQNTYDSPDQITHVGMYEGIVDGAPRMIDASGAAVRYDNPFSGFWAKHLVAAGRP